MPQANTGPHKPSRKQRAKSAVGTILVLVAAPLTALIITLFVFQSYEVEGPSMSTTLHDNDRLIVLKLGRSWAKFRGGAYLPQRGDIIVFNKSESQDTPEPKRQLIKRVVGLPNERVVITEGHVKVFNSQYPAGFNPDNNLAHGVITGPTVGNIDMTIPEDEVFVLGDNRSNSLDSRTFGTVGHNDIVGRLWVRIFPFNQFDRF